MLTEFTAPLLPPISPLVLVNEKLDEYWQAFSEASPVRLCRWIITDLDLPLLRQYLLNRGEANHTLQRLEINDWRTLNHKPGSDFIWLDWQGITQWTGAETWLQYQLKLTGNDRFIVIERQGDQQLKRIARWFPEQVQTAQPDVSLAKTVANLALMSDANTLEGQFNRQFVALNQAIAQRERQRIPVLQSACQTVCQQAGWLLMESTVLLTVGAFYVSIERAEDARVLYNQALQISEHVFAATASQSFPDLSAVTTDSDKPDVLLKKAQMAASTANRLATSGLSIQAWLGEAQACILNRRTGKLIDCLQQAVDRADLVGVYALGVEAARQLGEAYKRSGHQRLAVEAYKKALRFAEQLPASQRPLASLHAVGKALLPLMASTGERHALQVHIAQLLG